MKELFLQSKYRAGIEHLQVRLQVNRNQSTLRYH